MNGTDYERLRVEGLGELTRKRNRMFASMSVAAARELSPGETANMTDQQVLIALHKGRHACVDFPYDDLRRVSGEWLRLHDVPDLHGRAIPPGPIELQR